MPSAGDAEIETARHMQGDPLQIVRRDRAVAGDPNRGAPTGLKPAAATLNAKAAIDYKPVAL